MQETRSADETVDAFSHLLYGINQCAREHLFIVRSGYDQRIAALENQLSQQKADNSRLVIGLARKGNL